MPRSFRFKLSTLTAAVIFAGMAVITAVLGVIAYRRVYDRIQTGFDRKLVAISTVTAAFIDGTDHQAMMARRSETSPLYLRYVRPMQRIMEEKNITYLYTQIPTGGRNIIYGLDGTLGKDHSPIASADIAPPGEAAGILDVYRRGVVYLSGMRAWQEWGLLKSAYAPIYNRSGAIVAMSGADVNISLITEQTRMALLAVTGCGLILLAFAGFVSTRMARRTTGPISRLKSVALQVAAGHYGLQADIRGPTELRLLAGSFNRLSQSLDRRLQQFRHVNAAVEDRRRERLLLQALQRRDLTASRPPADCVRLIQFPSAHECRDASGWVRWQQQLLLWAAEPEDGPLAAARTRHDLALVFQPLLHRYAADWPALAGRLQPLFRDRVHGFLLIDLEAGRGQFLPRDCPAPHLDGAPMPAGNGGAQILPPGRLLSWSSQPATDSSLTAAVAAELDGDTAGALLDRLETRLASAPVPASPALLFLWQTGRENRPIEGLRHLLQKRGLLESHFAGLAPAELDLLLGAAQLEKRSPEESLSLQGERNEQLCLLLDGRVRIHAAGNPIVLSKPHWIGEFSFLYGGVANATVTALTPLLCLAWERAPLIALLQEHPALERNFTAVLAGAMSAKLSRPPFP